MTYDVNELREKVDGYFLGIFTKEELGKWSELAYYDLLKGGYIEKKKIVLYPFLKKISQFHIKVDDVADQYPCVENDINFIKEILQGKKNFVFQVEIAIPEYIYKTCLDKKYFDSEKRELLFEIRHILNNCVNEKITQQLYDMMAIFSGMPKTNDTIQDMLEEYIVRIFTKLIFDENNSDFILKTKMRLYTQKSEQEVIYKKLLKYLDYYVGNSNFNIVVSYENGLPDITLLL